MIVDNCMNDTIIKINNLYKLNNIKDLIDNKLEEIDHKSHIKGIAFYPETSGTRLIYLYSNTAMKGYNFEDSVKKSTNNENEEENVSEKDIDIPSETSAVFEMRPTEMMDVYKLYLLIKIKINNKKTVKSKKIDIAYIPTTECSKLCQNITHNKKKVLVTCVYNIEKRKWSPVDISTGKRPNFVKEIYK